MPAPIVEMFISGIWTDITDFVYKDSISLTYGQTDESSLTQPGTCTFKINNANGNFTPRNPEGIYYGKIGRNTQIRVSVTDPTGGTSKRAWMEMSEWPQNWDPTGADFWVEAAAGGILRRLQQGQISFASTLKQGLTTDTNVPVLYWPCEDDSNATQIASAVSGGKPMSIVGSPQLASFSGFACSSPVPVMGNGAFTCTVDPYTKTGSTQIKMLIDFPTAGSIPDSTALWQIAGNGTAKYFELYYDTGGSVGLRCFNPAGTNIGDSGPIAFNVDSTQHYFNVQLQESGGNINYLIEGFQPLSAGFLQYPGGGIGGPLVSGKTVGVISRFIIAPGKNLTGTAIGHVTLQTALSDISGLYTQLNAYVGEGSSDRAQRLTTSIGVASEFLGSFTGGFGGLPGGQLTLMGPQAPGKYMDLLTECATAEMAVVYEAWRFFGLGYREQNFEYNRTPALTLDYAAYNLNDIPVPLDDDRYTKNDVIVSRKGGSSARATLETGALSILPPPAGVGPYQDTPAVNLQNDSTLTDQANWRLHMGTVDEPRYPAITVNLAHSSFTSNPTLTHQVLNARPGDRIQVLNPPDQAQADRIDQLIIGGSETIDQFQHYITFICVPADPYTVFVPGDPNVDHADTDGSTVAAEMGTADTVISVATTNPASPLVTTNQADFPFDLDIGGEQIRAVANGTVVNANTDTIFQTLTGWSASNGSVALSQAQQYLHYSNSALVTPNGSSASGGLNSVQSAAASVTAAATYLLGAWVYCPAGWSDVRMCFDAYDNTGSFLSTVLGSATVIPAATWTYVTQTLTAPASSDRAVTRFRFGGTPANTVLFYLYNPTMVPSTSVDSTSPQTLTVVRSMNGVVKSHIAHEDLGGCDGTFETGLGTHWVGITGGTWALSTTVAHTGSNSGLLVTTGSPTQTFVRTSPIPVVAGDSHTFSFWVKLNSGTPSVFAAIDWLDASGNYISTSLGTTATATSSWVQRTVTATVPSNAAFAHFGPTITGSPAAGTAINVDDFSFGLPTGEDVRLFVPMILSL